MELRPCDECGRVSSSEVTECPYCGFRFSRPLPAAPVPVPQEEPLRYAALRTAVFFVLATIMAIAFILSLTTDRRKAPASPPPELTGQPAIVRGPGEKPEVPQQREVEKKPEEKQQKEAVPELQPVEEEPEKPEETPEHIETLADKTEMMFAQAEKALKNGKWLEAIGTCRVLLAKLGKDSPQAADIEHLLSLAEAHLYVAGADEIEKDILRGLLWLARHQSPDGRWDQDGFGKNCDPKQPPACDRPGTGQYDVAVTGLAVYAFYNHRFSHRGGIFSSTLKRGVDWLLSQQDKNGCFKHPDVESWIYNHAIGTMALCEAFTCTRDYRLQEPCRKAVDFILKAQNPGLGWKYEPDDGRSDTSVTGCMVMALKSAKTARLEVDEAAFQGAINWFDRATNTGGKTGYMRPGDSGSVVRGVNDSYAKLPDMTAVAVISRIFCRQSRRDPKIFKGVDILMMNLPDWNKPRNDKVDMYYWYYGSCAMFQYGGSKYKTWLSALKTALIENQRRGGCADGSWDPVGKWGMVGGRVYSTVMGVLALQQDHELHKVLDRNARRAIKERLSKFDWSGVSWAKKAPEPEPKLQPGDRVTVRLKDGASVEGEFISETKDFVKVTIKGSIIWEVPRGEIAEIKK